MSHHFDRPLRSAIHSVWILAALMCISISPAAAQQVVVAVNGDPITVMDIANRSKFITLSTHKTPTRTDVINELIDEKLKVHFAKRYRLEASDTDVDTTYAEMAGRMRSNAEGLTKVLTAQGIAPYTLKDRIRADIVWQQIVRGKYQSSFQVTDKEVATALEARKKDDKPTTGFDYTLRPILFVVASHAGDDAMEARKRDAEALKTRFEDCEHGIPFARSLRDTIVRAPITKSSGDLAPALRELLDKTPVGHLTNPEVTTQGVQIFAICEKKATTRDDSAKREIQNEKFSEQFQVNSTRLLKTLRAGAMIEYKEPVKEEPNAKRAGRNAR
jgi:peptidyl-prolyl cis-trans isomerase SurA